MYKFIVSSTNKSNWLKTNSKEICFIGRSNVGKSSLINSVVGVNGLAKTSKTPGRTQLINFFMDDKTKKVLVDLPGYGYAKMPIDQKEKMNNMIQEYFMERKQLILTFLLVDSKVGITKNDELMISFLKSINSKFIVLLTKVDKINQSTLSKNLKNVNEFHDDIILVSSKNGKNISKIKKIIDNIL